MTCGIRIRWRPRSVVFGAALALTCWSTSLAAQAQATTGVIRGIVSDPSGNIVVGAQVTVTDAETRFQRTVTTNEKGVFVAPLLPLGTYEVRARAVGLGERRQTGIVLRVGETVDLALKLEPVELAAVTVTATPVVDVSKVESSTRLPNQAVAGLPNNGRNFLNLTLLTPDLAHGTQTLAPDFRQHQFGFTLGGPLKRDKAFFFIAYDQQVYDEIKQKTRPSSPALDSLTRWMDTAFAGALRGDFGPISRTND